MNSGIVTQILSKAAVPMGITLPDTAISDFETYSDMLKRENQKKNLTAIENDEDIARLHFLDSLFLLKVVDFNSSELKSAKVIDIGSGAGFPGIPLKIAVPSIDLTILDATRKRIDFLKTLNTALSLDVNCIHGRAEEYLREQRGADSKESFDIVVSRAVARMNMLCELCLPYIKVGGFFPVMKATGSESEVGEAANAIKTLGAEICDIIDYAIPDTKITHRIILLQKTAKTPEMFPRRFARIEKSPL